MTWAGYSMYTGPGVPDRARRRPSRMISSVCSAYSMLAQYLTEGSSRRACWTNWMRPRRTRCSVIRARWPPRKMTGEFSTLAHIMAPARLARPGPSVPMHTAACPVIRDTASAMKPAASS